MPPVGHNEKQLCVRFWLSKHSCTMCDTAQSPTSHHTFSKSKLGSLTCFGIALHLLVVSILLVPGTCFTWSRSIAQLWSVSRSHHLVTGKFDFSVLPPSSKRSDSYWETSKLPISSNTIGKCRLGQTSATSRNTIYAAHDTVTSLSSSSTSNLNPGSVRSAERRTRGSVDEDKRHIAWKRNEGSLGEEEVDSEDDTGDSDSGQAGDRTRMQRNDKEWMFFDVAKINVKGGDGGDGCMAMRREFCIQFGGPSGGNGGSGGSVFLECDSRLNTLSALRRRVHHRGRDGRNGLGDSRHGPRGGDCVVAVPPGTIVRDAEGRLAGELNQHGQRLLVAKGGRGGRGNEHFKTPRMNAPAFAEKGAEGAERWLNIELKLIADVGLVGVPNAGKSTLLAACTNAKPKIAAYPFTTVVPNLGVCDLGSAEGVEGLVLADIPGMLEGAHEGVGLGLAFLRHVQRCRVLIHVVNGCSEDPVGDFCAINKELRLFNPRLARKPQVVVLNKADLPEVRARAPLLVQQLRQAAGHSRVVALSAAVGGQRVRGLMQRVRRMLDGLQAQGPDPLFVEDMGQGEGEVPERVSFEDAPDDHFEVLCDPDNFPGQFRVVGSGIEQLVQMTNWDFYESGRRFQRILEARGIGQALRKAGAVQGDLVMVGDWDFDFWDPRNRWVAELGLDELNPRRRYGQDDDDDDDG